MKNIVKIIIATVGIALIFTACQKEGDLPFYKEGKGSVELSSVATTLAPDMADPNKVVLSLNWTWPNYATDSVNQKFIVQIAPAGKDFEKPVTRVLMGKLSTTYTAKELNAIVFGFGTVSGPAPLEIRVVSSYANNNEQYVSNTIDNVIVYPYILPVNLSLDPTGPLTFTFETAASKAVTFNWNATEFGNLPVNYAIQIDKAGGTFENPLVIPFGTALKGDIIVTDLNRAAINAGIAANTTGDLAIRVIAYQGNFENPTYSNVATLKVTTYLDVVKFWVVGGYNGWDNSDNALFIINTPATGANAEGYINFTESGEFKLTTDHSWTDAHTFGEEGTGTGKLSNVGGGKNISVPSAGYYLIKANPLTMTYSLTPTTWGVMGDYNGWASQTDMAYNSTTKTFSLALTLTSGGKFKFRGTSDWAINYGSTAADGKTLNAGGGDIPVSITGDYALTLDLSHPNAYTYSANTWGLIGDATPGGWDNDTNMTWDATNQVFKVTLDLTAAKFKFRANDAWDINLGGDLNALAQNGADIAVATAGNYTITLDPWTLKATVTKN